MKLNSHKNIELQLNWKTYALSSVIAISILTIICMHIWSALYMGIVLRFADTYDTMITAVDGFFYLAEAKAYLAQGGNSPALSVLIALLYKITGFELTNIAFWIPVVLAFCFSFVYVAWARLLNYPFWISGLAVMFGMLMPAWIERSKMGWFDTDPGIALLWQTCIVSTAFLAMPNRRFSLQAFLFMIISGSLLAWWWQPAIFLLPACFTMWGIAFLWAKDKKEKRLRLINSPHRCGDFCNSKYTRFMF